VAYLARQLDGAHQESKTLRGTTPPAVTANHPLKVIKSESGGQLRCVSEIAHRNEKFVSIAPKGLGDRTEEQHLRWSGKVDPDAH
jgi:hypothetical protein